jgi:integrase
VSPGQGQPPTEDGSLSERTGIRPTGKSYRRKPQRRPAHAAALMLLLLTGCRKNEIVGLKWGEVRGSRIYLDDSKTGARTVFLCTQARDILANIKRGKASELVFKGQYGSRIDIDNYWQTIRRKAKLGAVRIHDARPRGYPCRSRRSSACSGMHNWRARRAIHVSSIEPVYHLDIARTLRSFKIRPSIC